MWVFTLQKYTIKLCTRSLFVYFSLQIVFQLKFYLITKGIWKTDILVQQQD